MFGPLPGQGGQVGRGADSDPGRGWGEVSCAARPARGHLNTQPAKGWTLVASWVCSSERLLRVGTDPPLGPPSASQGSGHSTEE